MATINDIGTPGAPLDSPPLTEWQAAVRDALTAQTPTTALFVASGPDWADIGGAYAGLFCTKEGGMVTIEGTIKRVAADISVTSSAVTIGTIPVGFRPAHDVSTSVQINASVGYPTCRLIVTTAGLLRIQAGPAVTIQTNGWVSPLVTYRQGN